MLAVSRRMTGGCGGGSIGDEAADNDDTPEVDFAAGKLKTSSPGAGFGAMIRGRDGALSAGGVESIERKMDDVDVFCLPSASI